MPVNPTEFGDYAIQDQGDNPDAWGVEPTEGLNNQASTIAEAIHSTVELFPGEPVVPEHDGKVIGAVLGVPGQQRVERHRLSPPSRVTSC